MSTHVACRLHCITAKETGSISLPPSSSVILLVKQLRLLFFLSLSMKLTFCSGLNISCRPRCESAAGQYSHLHVSRRAVAWGESSSLGMNLTRGLKRVEATGQSSRQDFTVKPPVPLSARIKQTPKYSRLSATRLNFVDWNVDVKTYIQVLTSCIHKWAPTLNFSH